MVVGITDTGKETFENYVRWVQRSAPDVKIEKLSYKLNAGAALAGCDGLLLTGGGDIHPKFYDLNDKPDVLEDVDPERDKFEFGLIHEALRQETPILGICRGMQVFNVALGGSMIPDVQRTGFKKHSQKKDEPERIHAIDIVQGSLLHSIVDGNIGAVNTNHHQAVDRIGVGLHIVARSQDGLVEALEWEQARRKPFLLLVQWHPERMSDFENPCSKTVLTRFLEAMGTQRPNRTALYSHQPKQQRSTS